MNLPDLDENYWQNRYLTQDTGWDLGTISTPLREYFNSLTDKNVKILIPGCGRGYEAEYLFRNGFKNVFPSDIAESAKADFYTRVPDFPKENWISDDFFSIERKFDLIIEQTFFCALNPELRKKYVLKMYDLLNNEGKLAGLLFDFNFESENPPYGGTKDEYLNLFESHFKILKMEKCYNSIPPRAGRELFFILEKK